MAEAPKPQSRRLVLLVWVLVAVFYFYLSYDYIRVSNNDRIFAEYLAYVVQLAGSEGRPSKEVRELILVKADELGIPLSGETIQVLGGGPTLTVSLDYQGAIEIPFFERVVYRKKFSHDVKYHVSR